MLPAINALKKLCNHPKLIYDMIQGAKKSGGAAGSAGGAAGFETCEDIFTPGMYDSRGAGGRGRGDGGSDLHSFPYQLNLSASVHRLTQINS